MKLPRISAKSRIAAAAVAAALAGGATLAAAGPAAASTSVPVTIQDTVIIGPFTGTWSASGGISDSGTMPWKVAVLTRTMSIAPIFTCSTVSFSEPSALSPKILTLSLPPVAFDSCSPMYFTAMLVGKSLAWTSAERKSRASTGVAKMTSAAATRPAVLRMRMVMSMVSLGFIRKVP